MSTQESESLLKQAQLATESSETLRLAGAAVSAELLAAMKAAGISKSDKSVSALRAAGLDGLLAMALANGRLRYTPVTEFLARLRTDLQDRSLSAEQIKDGILAFDSAAQRLAMVSGSGGGFVYPTKGNRARDSLMTFARSLHR
jgi:hypothetical protein